MIASAFLLELAPLSLCSGNSTRNRRDLAAGIGILTASAALLSFGVGHETILSGKLRL